MYLAHEMKMELYCVLKIQNEDKTDQRQLWGLNDSF